MPDKPPSPDDLRALGRVVRSVTDTVPNRVGNVRVQVAPQNNEEGDAVIVDMNTLGDILGVTVFPVFFRLPEFEQEEALVRAAADMYFAPVRAFFQTISHFYTEDVDMLNTLFDQVVASSSADLSKRLADLVEVPDMAAFGPVLRTMLSNPTKAAA
jgi:hypothetical protein